MFHVKNITAKNFLSIGNVTQSIKFDQDLTLILGSNKDLGGDNSGSRNGVGKTSLLNALSYAIYGQALTNIRKENLINATNGKHMLVTVEFEKDHKKYRIERGRKPNVLKIFVDDQERKIDDEDDSQGDSRETQKYIEQIVGISHLMFKHLIALNTYTEPFLSLKAADQREVIENLLGITILSEKAENLKVEIKESKDLIQKEQYRIDGIKAANENIQKSISSLELKSKAWNSKREKEFSEINDAISKLKNVDIDQEIKSHETLKIWKENSSRLKDLTLQRNNLSKTFLQIEKNINKIRSQIEDFEEQTCPLCKQRIEEHDHQDIVEKTKKELSDLLPVYDQTKESIENINEEIEKISELGDQPKTFYRELNEALNHKNILNNLEKDLNKISQEINPFDEQISELKETAIQEIDWSLINDLNKLKDHQEFLLKLLTNKDSFIRKKIIDQNLGFLNKRLKTYTQNIGLPHQVLFQNDLSVSIQQFGQDLDFDNLSRGERNRLILSLSLAFRDLFESIFDQINVLFIDELIDFGMDGAGVESGLNILKQMARERKKNIYLISHREELIGRVNNVLRVIKENGFTSYLIDGEV